METPLSARAALLQALAVPGYGLDLIERVRRDSGGHVRLRMGSVYPALERLQREGLVVSRLARERKAGRPRKYYALTRRGVLAAMSQRQALAGLLRFGPARPEDARRMSERLSRTAAVSASVLELRSRMRDRDRRG